MATWYFDSIIHMYDNVKLMPQYVLQNKKHIICFNISCTTDIIHTLILKSSIEF